MHKIYTLIIFTLFTILITSLLWKKLNLHNSLNIKSKTKIWDKKLAEYFHLQGCVLFLYFSHFSFPILHTRTKAASGSHSYFYYHNKTNSVNAIKHRAIKFIETQNTHSQNTHIATARQSTILSIPLLAAQRRETHTEGGKNTIKWLWTDFIARDSPFCSSTFQHACIKSK